MQEELDKYSAYPKGEQDQLREALETWRFPYWDWALKKPVSDSSKDYTVPLVVKQQSVVVRQPTVLGYGPIPNAFYQFSMPKNISMGDHSLANDDPLQDLRIVPSLFGNIPIPVSMLQIIGKKC
jgi:tyrosinase